MEMNFCRVSGGEEANRGGKARLVPQGCYVTGSMCTCPGLSIFLKVARIQPGEPHHGDLLQSPSLPEVTTSKYQSQVKFLLSNTSQKA